jgi:hypothetical protein
MFSLRQPGEHREPATRALEVRPGPPGRPGPAVLESFHGPRNLSPAAVDTWFVAAATGVLGSGLFDAAATCATIVP